MLCNTRRSKPIYIVQYRILLRRWHCALYTRIDIAQKSFVRRHVRGVSSPAASDHLNAQLPRHRRAHDDIFQVSREGFVCMQSRVDDVPTVVYAGHKFSFCVMIFLK